MFAKLLTVIVIATSVVARPAVLRRGDVSLSDWPSQNLESYWKFKMRYNSLNCASQSGTDFYTSCCYPLGASESLSDRPAECTPTTCSAPTSSSASNSTPTYEAASVPTESANGDNEDLPFCEEGDDGEWDDSEETSSSNGDYSAYVAPTNYVTPTATYEPAPSSDNSQPTTTQAQNTPTPDNNNNNSGNVNYGGVATYYYQNGNPGACGDYHGDGDLIAAIDIERYGDTGVKSSLCGQRVHIKNTNNGQIVEVVIADACPSCNNGNSIDLSYGAFGAIASYSDGQVPIEWYFI